MYIDTSHFKLNGQELIQMALAEKAKQEGLYSDFDDAKICVYSQFGDKSYGQAKQAKQEGKIVVFCHHYSAAKTFSSCYVIKNNCFDAIDYHVVMRKDSELYEYLIANGVDKKKIIFNEFALTNYKTDRYFTHAYKIFDLIFVGRYDKGFDDFVDYVHAQKNIAAIALCPDVHKSNKDYSDIKVITNAAGEEVLKFMSLSRFIYSYSSYNVPKFHLETTMQEAIMCGCVNLVDNMYYYVLDTNNLNERGFTNTLCISEAKRRKLAEAARLFQSQAYFTRDEMITKLFTKLKKMI